MGYKDFQNFEGASGEHQDNTITLDGSAERIELPDASYVKDAELSRDGMDLIMDGPQGQVVIDGYFAQVEGPTLHGPDGSSLNANLVNSFVKSSPLYADAGSMSDESPVGAVHEITGGASVTRTDGSSETIQLGTPIYQGDIIETSADGAVNVMFIDETSFAVSEDARLAIDEYVFDPASSEGVTNFSVLKGVFVFTSGLIGREDPDDVHIETPVGSIGIRGTIIAGDVNAGEITVVEGAIVLRDGLGNEMTLANQFETAKFDTANGTIDNMGLMAANDVAIKFSSVSGVAAQLFSSINDVAQEQAAETSTQNGEVPADEQNLDANNDGTVDGTVDENGDGAADGTVEGAQDGEAESGEGTEAASDDQSDAGEAVQDGTGETQTASADAQTTQAPAPAPMQSSTSTNGGLGSSATKASASTTSGGAESTTTTTATAKAASTTTTSSSTTQTKSAITQSTDTATQPRVLETRTDTDTTTNPPAGGGGTVTPFAVSVAVEPTIYENELGAKIATFSGAQLDISSIELLGPYADFFYVTPGTNAGEADVFLQASFDLDFESLPSFQLDYTAMSTNGVDSVSNEFFINVTNVDDAAEYTSYLSGSGAQIGAGQTWSYDFSQHASDEDVSDTPEIDIIIRNSGGDIIFDSNINSYLDSADTFLNNAEIDSINFNPDGTITINVFDTLTNDDYLELDIYMNGAFQENIQFNYFAPTGNIVDGTSTDISSGTFAMTSGVSTGVVLTGTNGTVTFSDLDDMSIELQTSYSTINAGAGNDVISIQNGEGNTALGGSGDDVIIVREASNYVYGGSDNDEIVIDFVNGDVWGDLQTISSATSQIDGGTNSTLNPFFINFETTVSGSGQAGRTFNGQGDVLRIDTDINGGNTTAGDVIDFSAMVNDVILNIEILDIDNGDNNQVILNTTDIFDMTDHNHTLVIRGDANDSLNFDTLGESYTDGGTITDNDTGDTYNVFFSAGANVTLLVDTDIATSIDGAAV